MIGRLALRAAAALCLSIAPASTFAQTASQITPPSFAPPVAPPSSSVEVQEHAATAAPPGAERLTVTPGSVTIEGMPSDSSPAVAAVAAGVRARLTGRQVTVAEIFAAAHELEVAYARGGRVLVRVAVPTQTLNDGAAVRLIVIDGAIERVDTSAVPAPMRARVARLLRPLSGRPGVRLSEIERRLLLAGDAPGVTLRSALSAGSAPGTSVLIVSAIYRPVEANFSLDNTLADALGRLTFGLGLTFNGVAGLGDQIYLRANGLPTTGSPSSVLDGTPRNRALAAGLIVPVSGDGLSVNIEGTDARTAPRPGPFFATGSRFRRLSARVRYPLIRSRALTITSEAAFDALDERVRIIDPVIFPLSRDTVRVARGTVDGSLALRGGARLFAHASLAFGIDGLGARSAATASPDEPLSRDGADDDFRTLELAAGADVLVARHLALSLHARALTGFGRPLLNSQQIGLATTDALSPLPAGTLQGDSGYVARGEVQLPFYAARQALFGAATPYGFGTHGGVRLYAPTAVERPRTDAYAYGAGVRFAAQRDATGLNAGLEWGRAHVAGRPGPSSRITFAIAAQL